MPNLIQKLVQRRSSSITSTKWQIWSQRGQSPFTGARWAPPHFRTITNSAMKDNNYELPYEHSRLNDNMLKSCIKEIRKCNGYVFMARLEYIRIDCTISPDTIIGVLHRYCNLFIRSIMSLSAHRLTRVIFNYLEWEINAIFNAENT